MPSRERAPAMVRQRSRRQTARLLERALWRAFPSNKFPFSVQLNIDLLSADGSGEMTALSAACLAMAQTGVPLTAHVAGTTICT